MTHDPARAALRELVAKWRAHADNTEQAFGSPNAAASVERICANELAAILALPEPVQRVERGGIVDGVL
jgi:hypothetical protein